MSWSTIRRATAEDIERLNAAAVRFAARHADNVQLDEITPCSLDLALEQRSDDHYSPRLAELRRAWRNSVHRALGCKADGIAYGYVGNHVE